MRTYVKEVIIGALVLIVISLSLIILLESNIDIKKILDLKTVVLSLSTFGGAGLGALLAGQYSVVLFKKNIKHEEDKREAEQIVKKAIYLNDYLKGSWGLMEDLRLFNISFYGFMTTYKENYPDKNILDYEIKSYLPVLQLFKEHYKPLLLAISNTEKSISTISYDHINDYNFVKMISENKLLIRKTESKLKEINNLVTLNSFPDLNIVEDGVASIQKYLGDFENFEKILREYK